MGSARRAGPAGCTWRRPAPPRRGRTPAARKSPLRPAGSRPPSERPELVDAEAERGDEDDRNGLRGDLVHAELDEDPQDPEIEPEGHERHDQEAHALVVEVAA